MALRLRLATAVLLALVAALAGTVQAQAAQAPLCTGSTAAVTPGDERAIRLDCSVAYGMHRTVVEVVDRPAHGTLGAVDERRMVVAYRPAAGFRGTDRFTFRATAGPAASATVTQEVVVSDDDFAPVCPPLRAVVAHGSVRLPACVDPNEGDAVSVEVVTAPEHGTARPDGTGLEYVAPDGVLGTDRFTVRASDGDRTTSVLPVEVELNGPSAPHCADVFDVPVRTGTPKRIEPDCDGPDDTWRWHSLELVEAPRHGNAEPEGWGGRLRYTPRAGYRGPDTMVVRPVLGDRVGDELTIGVRVADDANEPPVCRSDGPADVGSGGSVQTGVWCWDPDDDPLDLSMTERPAHGGYGVARPPFVGTYTADEGFVGVDHFTVTASDGRATAAASQTVRVGGARMGPDAPPTCEPQVVRTATGTTSPAFDTWCRSGGGAPVTGQVVRSPAHGTLTRASGGWTYVPSPGFVGEDAITVTATTTAGTSAPTTVRFLVGSAAAPTCRRWAPRAVRPGQTTTFYFSCHDGRTNFPAVLASGPSHGTVTVEGEYFRYTPDAGYAGADAFTVRGADGAASVEVTQELVVDPAHNTAPVCHRQYAVSARAGTPLRIDVACFDAEDDPIAVTLPEGGRTAHGTFGAYADESYRWTSGNLGYVTYTADAGHHGRDVLPIVARDDRGGESRLEQAIVVRDADANSPPRCDTNSTYLGQAGRETVGWTHCYDADGDPITYEVLTPPAHGTFDGPSDRGRWTYVPAAGFEGMDEGLLRASDGRSTTDFPLRVEVGRQQVDPPPCRPLGLRTPAGRARSFALTCDFDPIRGQGQPGHVELVTPPVHGSLSAIGADGTVTYTPAPGFTGTDRLTFRGVQGGKAGEIEAVEIEVRPVAPGAAELDGDDATTVPPVAAGAADAALRPAAPPPIIPSVPPAGDPASGPAPRAPGSPQGDRVAAAMRSAAARRLAGRVELARTPGLGPARAFLPVGATTRGVPLPASGSIRIAALVCPESDCRIAVTSVLVPRTAPRARQSRLHPAQRLPVRRVALRVGSVRAIRVTVPAAARRAAARMRGPAALRLSLAVRDATGATGRATLVVALRQAR